MTMLLSDLPDEMLQKIGAYLDPSSVFALAQALVRYRDVAHLNVSHLRITQVNDNTERLLDWYGSTIRSLDLSNCLASSDELETLILKCLNLVELSAVNTRLTIDNVIEFAQQLYHMHTIRFGLSTADLVSERRPPGREFPKNKQLRRVYVEVTPTTRCYRYAINFINSCTNLEWLHWFVVDNGVLSDPDSEGTDQPEDEQVPQICPLATMHTVIVSWETPTVAARSPVPLSKLIKGISEWQWLLLKLHYAADDHRFRQVVIERGACNLVPATRTWEEIWRQLADDEFAPPSPTALNDIPRSSSYFVDRHSLLDVLPVPSWGAPRRLTVFFETAPYILVNVSHPVRCFANLITRHLTELNLIECHMLFPEVAWCDLIVAAPALKALAFPACFLSAVPYADEDHLMSSTTESCHVINALSQLPLRDLHISGAACSVSSCAMPIFVFGKIIKLGEMSRLRQLESLTMINVPLKGMFVDNLANPTVKTLKLSCSCSRRRDCDYPTGLQRLLPNCTSLENLKLHIRGMHLHESPIWEAIGGVRQLRRLCLLSGRLALGSRIQHVVTSNLGTIGHKLRHLHIHRVTDHRQVAEQLNALFASSAPQWLTPASCPDSDGLRLVEPSTNEDTARRRGKPPSNKCRCTIVVTPASRPPPRDLMYPLPARSLCSSATFIGHVKPEGWEFTN